LFGGFGLSSKARHQNKFTSNITISNIVKGLRIISGVVGYCNNNVPKNSDQNVLIYQKAISLLNKVYLYSDLSSHRVLSILILLGTISTTSLGTHAVINKGTKTYKRLLETYKIQPCQMCQILSILCRKHNIDTPTAENLVCEAFRERKVYDTVVAGQCLYNILVDTSKSKAYHERYYVAEIWGSNQTIPIIYISFPTGAYFCLIYLHWLKPIENMVQWNNKDLITYNMNGNKYQLVTNPIRDIIKNPNLNVLHQLPNNIKKQFTRKQKGKGIVYHTFGAKYIRHHRQVVASQATCWRKNVTSITVLVTLQQLMKLCLIEQYTIVVNEKELSFEGVEAMIIYNGVIKLSDNSIYGIPNNSRLFPEAQHFS
jgi:hypothetical protein